MINKALCTRLSMVSLFVILLLGTVACSDHEFDGASVQGVWGYEFLRDDNQTSRYEYFFKEDGTVEISGFEVDQHSHEILGYYYRNLGSYKTTGNMISFYDI